MTGAVGKAEEILGNFGGWQKDPGDLSPIFKTYDMREGQKKFFSIFLLINKTVSVILREIKSKIYFNRRD